VLAALPEHHHEFVRISHNPWLVPSGVAAAVDGLSLDELRSRAWAVMSPHFDERVREATNRFREAVAHGKGSDALDAVGAAAVQNRVAILLVDADRRMPGRIDRETGAIELAPLERPDVDDLLDDLAEQVLTRGGTVLVIPSDRMPSATGVAATFRY
jgi:hypothetical protein